MKWKKTKEQEYAMSVKTSAKMLFTFYLLLLKKLLVHSGNLFVLAHGHILDVHVAG